MKIFTFLATAALVMGAALSVGAPSAGANSLSTVGADATAGVFASYFEIQKALAEDSLQNVAANAGAIAAMVRQNPSGPFQPELAADAEALAGSQDLIGARQIFKAVSGYLIQAYRAGHNPGGAIHEAHSPVGNVNWLQQGDVLQNPYTGKSDPHCGTFVS
jgi:hypothetical protein